MRKTDMVSFVEYPPKSGIQINNFNGEVWGETGVLRDDGDRVQCHSCGEWYILLSSHVYQTHGIGAAQYREAFGLNRTQALASSELRQRKRRYMKREIQSGRRSGELLSGYHGSSITKGSKQRLQSVNANQRAHPTKYIDANCSVCGGLFRPKANHPRITCSAICRTQNRKNVTAARGSGMSRKFWDELNQDPQRRSAHITHTAEKRRGPTVDKVCSICKKGFSVIPSRADKVRTCGDAHCRTEWRHQIPGKPHTEAAKAKMSQIHRNRSPEHNNRIAEGLRKAFAEGRR